MDFTPNQSGLDRIFTQIAVKIEAVDADLRARFTGAPSEDIVGPATEAFRDIGIEHLDEEWLRDYAEAVSANEPYSINLG